MTLPPDYYIDKRDVDRNVLRLILMKRTVRHPGSALVVDTADVSLTLAPRNFYREMEAVTSKLVTTAWAVEQNKRSAEDFLAPFAKNAGGDTIVLELDYDG